jgi:alanine or glycine:cation symporter, AGCS family
MYYIERGLGKNWKPLAIFFAGALMITSFLTGNAVQANTVAQTLFEEFRSPVWLSGLLTASIVGMVIIGGITRIGRVTGILAPVMALIYVFGALLIIGANIGGVPGAFGLIFSEAFNPTSGVAGTGAGVFLLTLMHGVRRGLFSNEAGQGSAPIAHAAAKTDEPVSEGVVALLEPFIDTILICTMTGLVIILTGVWDDRFHTELNLSGDQISYVSPDQQGVMRSSPAPAEIAVIGGVPEYRTGDARFSWQNVAVEQFWTDPGREVPFSGRIIPGQNLAVDADGTTTYTALYGDAPRTGAVLTMAGFERGLDSYGLGWLGRFIVIASVLLFAISTSIAWSYYGDRCANYLFVQCSGGDSACARCRVARTSCRAARRSGWRRGRPRCRAARARRCCRRGRARRWRSRPPPSRSAVQWRRRAARGVRARRRARRARRRRRCGPRRCSRAPGSGPAHWRRRG